MECRSRISTLGIIYLTLFAVSGLVALPALESEEVWIGDRESFISYGLRGSKTGVALSIKQREGASLQLNLYPWLAWYEDAIRAWDGTQSTQLEGCELLSLEIEDRFDWQAGFWAAGEGVWIWELGLSNQSSETQAFRQGFAVGLPGEWDPQEGVLVFNDRDLTCALGLVSPTGVLWSPREEEDGAGGFFAQELELEPQSVGNLTLVLILEQDEARARETCQAWMRLVASERALARARSSWLDFLAEGMSPVFCDRQVQVSFERSLRTLVLMAWNEADQGDLQTQLELAKTLQTFGRDQEAGLLLNRASRTIKTRGLKNLARQVPALLLRYSGLVAQHTINSGRLAGDLNLVEEGISLVTEALLANPSSELVQLESILYHDALLFRLARKTDSAQTLLSNAGLVGGLVDDLWSLEARAWTNRAGFPSSEVLRDDALKNDLLYDNQYRVLKRFSPYLSPVEQAKLLQTAALSFDAGWFLENLEPWVEASQTLEPGLRLALWLDILSAGSLAGILKEQEVCSFYRLSTLYRRILEMRHASTRVAASFVYRDLRSYLKDQLGQADLRDVESFRELYAKYCELLSEIKRTGLPDKLEEVQISTRLKILNRLVMSLYGMVEGIELDSGFQLEGERIRFQSDRVELKLPGGWQAGQLETQEGAGFVITRPSEAGLIPELAEFRLALTPELSLRGSIPLAHPSPLAWYVLEDPTSRSRLILENRGTETLRLKNPGGDFGLILDELPAEIQPQSAIGLNLGCLAQKNAELSLEAEDRSGREYFLEKSFPLPERLGLDYAWLHLSERGLIPLWLDPEKLPTPSLDQTGLIRLQKTLSGVFQEGSLTLALKIQPDRVRVLVNKVELEAQEREGWSWYRLNAKGSALLVVELIGHEGLREFARAEKILLVGTDK